MKIPQSIKDRYFYRNYVDSCIRKGKPYVDEKTFIATVKASCNVMAGVLITEGRVTFPGTIFTLDLRREKKPVRDLLAMRGTDGKTIIYNFNEHTFGYTAKFGINDHGLKKRSYYIFKKSTKLKEILVKYLKSDPRNILKYRIQFTKYDNQ